MKANLFLKLADKISVEGADIHSIVRAATSVSGFINSAAVCGPYGFQRTAFSHVDDDLLSENVSLNLVKCHFISIHVEL